MYSKEDLQRGLKTRVVGSRLFVFDSIDSTSVCARTLAEAGTGDGAVVFADHQTSGRGRLGRLWVSDPGTNLLFSVLLRPPLRRDQSAFLTFYAAASVAKALETVTGRSTECKWPNDVLLNGKKCCGILLENSFAQDRLDFSIIGIGLNVNQREFDDELSLRATSLVRELNVEFDRKQLLQRILEEMDQFYPEVKEGHFNRVMKFWNDRCSMFGKNVKISQSGKQISGTAVGLSADGGLVLKTTHGETTFYAGDVTVSL